MALQIIAGAIQLAGAINNNKTKETDPEAQATTNEPMAETKTKEPPTLKESIDTNVIFTACCGICSVLCICTIPLLIPVFVAALLLAVARRKMDAGDKEGAEHLNSIADILNMCTFLFYIILVILGGLFILLGLPFIIIYAS